MLPPLRCCHDFFQIFDAMPCLRFSCLVAAAYRRRCHYFSSIFIDAFIDIIVTLLSAILHYYDYFAAVFLIAPADTPFRLRAPAMMLMILLLSAAAFFDVCGYFVIAADDDVAIDAMLSMLIFRHVDAHFSAMLLI